MKSRRWIIATVATVAALLLIGRAVVGWYVDYVWYVALGAGAVWRARAMDLVLLRGGTFLGGTLFVFANLFAVRRSIRKVVLPRRVGNLDFGEEVPSRYLLIAVILMSLVIGALLALPQNDWMSLDLIRNGVPFGETDPYFQYDLAFWVYWLPLEWRLHVWALLSLLTASLVVLFLYALTPSLRWENGQLHVSGYVRRHLFTLGAVLLLLLSWSYRLDAYTLLNDGSGPLGVFAAIDHRIGLPANLILQIVAIAAAMFVIWSGWTGQIRLAFFTITAVLLIALTMRQIVPPIAERFITPSDPALREGPYLQTENGYTRRAYDVDRLSRDDNPWRPPAFADATRGAALWDGITLSRALTHARGDAKPNGGLGWEVQDARVVAFSVLQPVRPDSATSAGSPPAWRTVRVAADVADERGGVVERKDPEDSLAGTLGSVLISDAASGYYIVADSADHVPAPELRSLGTRIAHAWHLQDPRLLTDALSGPHRRIILHRDVRERLRALYPFFEQGGAVTPVVLQDSLFWAVHLYATSDWYPLSRAMRLGTHEQLHYLHHAAVALINAHTGRTRAIGDALPDPVTSSWMHRFPELFSEPGRMNRDLTRRLPPALDGLLTAAIAFAQVGVRGQHEAPRRIPASTGDTIFTLATTPPYFDRVAGLLAVAVPVFDPLDRLAGVIVCEGGPDFRPMWHAFDTLGVPGPKLVPLLQEQGDSLRHLVGDTRLLQGATRVIPTRDGMLAFETHYMLHPEGPAQVVYVSVLHRDTAMHRDTVTAGATLVAATGLPMPAPAEQPLTPPEFRARVDALYAAMRDALRRGDWPAFGLAYESLGRLLHVPR